MRKKQGTDHWLWNDLSWHLLDCHHEQHHES